MSHPLIKKQIVKDFHDDQSILLMTIGNTFQKDEQRLIKKSRLLTEKDGVAFYDLPLSAFTENMHYKNVSAFKNIYHTDDKNQGIYWQDFAWGEILKKGNLISDFYIHNTNFDTLELSIWIEIPTFNYEPMIFNLDLSDGNKKLIQRYFLDYRNSTDLMADKIRLRTKIYTGIKDNYFKLSSNINSNSHIGTLLVKPLQTTIATVSENGEVFLDNYSMEKQ
ncbi:MAG: hypothetical protein M9887_06260 [Chitinophagales bacterium]|nr:hypothetical protein [Chitinophagales bacterium]